MQRACGSLADPVHFLCTMVLGNPWALQSALPWAWLLEQVLAPQWVQQWVKA